MSTTPKKRKRVKGGPKGARFERRICKELSLWVSNEEREDCFWRSSMSGGRATLHIKRGRKTAISAQAGDITAIHKKGMLLSSLVVIDCKEYKSMKWHCLIYGNAGVVQPAWEKLGVESRRDHKSRLLVCTESHQPIIACVDFHFIALLSASTKGCPKVIAEFPQLEMAVLSWDWLMEVPFNEIRNYCRNTRWSREVSVHI